jgi:hypothetical protein
MKATMTKPPTITLLIGLIALVLFFSPQVIADLFLYDTSLPPDTVYWRLAIFYRTIGLALIYASLALTLIGMMISALALRKSPALWRHPASIATGMVLLILCGLHGYFFFPRAH